MHTLTALQTSGPEPAFLQPVPRHLVHRASVAEVFITDAIPKGGSHFLVAAQWPRDHSLYHPDQSGLSDPLLIAETVRQAMVCLAHQYYDVPLTHRFVGFGLDFAVTDTAPLRIGGAPLPVVLDAVWSWVGRHRPPHRYEMRMQALLSIGGHPCAHGTLHMMAVDERRYGLLRNLHGESADAAAGDAGQESGIRLPAQRVGRLRAKDSVLEQTTDGSWQLHADPCHAILFDHPVDHVPLMAQLEGFRQLGHVLAHERAQAAGAPGDPVLTGLDSECAAFAELDRPVRLVEREQQHPDGPGGPIRLLVDAEQDGKVVTTVRMTWRPSASPDGGA